MKVTITGLVHEIDWGYGEPKEYRLYKYDQSDDHTALIGPVEFEYEVPEDFNPVPAKLAAIEKAKQELRAKYQAKVEELNEQASKLQALTFDGVTV